jgi:hypothetical protein
MGISNALVYLGMLPVQDVAQFPKPPQEILPVADLLLKHWPLASVCGTEFGSAAVPDFGSSAPSLFFFPLFFLDPQNSCKRYFSVYIYVDMYL